MKYAAKSGSRLKINVQSAGERLEKIRKKHDGRLLPKDVVEDARPEKSLLHPQFEWDDSTAAEEYRRVQARELIRAIVVVEVKDDGPKGPVRAFVHVLQNGDDEETYTHIDCVMSNPDLRDQLLDRAKEELLSWRRRYDNLKELAAVYEAIDLVTA